MQTNLISNNSSNRFCRTQNIKTSDYSSNKAYIRNNTLNTADTISFSGNFNKITRGLCDKLEDIYYSRNFKETASNLYEKLTDIFVKGAKEKRLKREAEEAARIAEEDARIAEEKAKYWALETQNIIKSAKEALIDWRSCHKGQFEKRICKDNTGDVIFDKPEVLSTPSEYIQPPKRGEYGLTNFGNSMEYISHGVGQNCITCRYKGEGKSLHIFDTRMCDADVMETYPDYRWHMRHVWVEPSSGYNRPRQYLLPRKVTYLSCGYDPDRARAYKRYPGATFAIEGHIPFEDISAIKKNIVEKGIWQHYTDTMKTTAYEATRFDARLAVYNEILKYLNKQ